VDDIEAEALHKFSEFDRDGNGTIETQELVQLIRSFPMCAGQSGIALAEWCSHMLTLHDVNNDGTLQFEEFVPIYNECVAEFLYGGSKQPSSRRGEQQVAEQQTAVLAPAAPANTPSAAPADAPAAAPAAAPVDASADASVAAPAPIPAEEKTAIDDDVGEWKEGAQGLAAEEDAGRI
jgi:hypothetical protein